MSLSLELPFGIKVINPLPLDEKYLNVNTNSPYTSSFEVDSVIPISIRHIGLTVNVNGVEYWFKDGLDISDLVIKTSFDISAFTAYTATTEIRLSGIESDITTLSGFTINSINNLENDIIYISGQTQPIINLAVTGATNGLTKSGRNVLLGGTLQNNTSLNRGIHNLTITGSSGTLTLGSGNNNFVADPSGIIIQLSGSSNFRYATNNSLNYTNRSVVDKEYVDNLIGGFQPKQSVRVATTAPLTGATYSLVGNGQFTGAPTVIDGITLANGNRILVKNQVDAKQNGIYIVVSSGVWSRDVDMDGSPSTEVRAGIYTFVETGDTLVGTGWVLIGGNITGSTLNLNVDDINWALFSITPNPYIGGDGIEFSGNTIYIDTAPNSSLDFSGGQLRVNPNIAGDGLSYLSGILNVVANNGLTVNGNSVRLGGTLTGNTEINGSGYTLSILSNDKVEISTTNELILEAPNLIYIDSNVGEILIGYTNNSGVTIGNQSGNRIRVKNEVGDAGQSTSGIKVELFSGSTFEYNNDYSANFTPRSLVDKEYVDNLVTSGVTGFVTEVTFNSYTGATENDLNYISGITNTKLNQSIFNSYTGNSQPILNGAITGVTNLGSGTGLFAQLNGRNVELKSLVAGSNITLTPTSTGITISSLGGGSGSGERIEYTFTQSGHSFSFGDVVEYSGTSFIKALAQSNRDAEIIGFVSDVNGSDFTVVFSGYLQGLSGLSLTNNTTYYLSSTVSGALTSTVPTIEGTLNKPILTTFTNNDGLVFQYRAFVNSTGTTGGGSGTTLQNVGGGSEVFSGASGSFSYLRTLVGSGNTTVSTVGDNIIIFSSGGTGSTNQSSGIIITGATYTATTASDFIGVSASTTVTIDLPSTPNQYQKIIVSDIVGNASIYNIIIDGNGNQIVGSNTAIINSDYSSIMFLYNGYNWSIIGFS